MTDLSFEFAEKSEKLNKLKMKAFSILEANEQYNPVLQRIKADLNEKENEDKLRITFVGQYNAGKSTIISALTGNDNIKIDSNISTDSMTKYPWHDVLLVDTPGLGTQHPEHDAITEEAIKQADIVVYCLTSSLFDNLTLKDFQKLAYERGYFWKMFLVINKMDKERGSYENLVGNYKETLIKTIGEGRLSKFPLGFISAQWQRDSDLDIRKESHFNDFINQLNNFINVNGQMAKLMGPANIFIDNIQQGIIEKNDSENNEFYMILDRVDRKYGKQERECNFFFRSIINDLHSKIINVGYELANKKPESLSEAEEISKKAELHIEEYCNSVSLNLKEKFVSVQKELDNALLEISESDLVRNYYAVYPIKHEKIDIGSSHKKGNTVNIEILNTIFSIIRDASVEKALGATSENIIYQAVSISINIGKFAKVLAPMMIAAPVVVEVIDIAMEKQQEMKERERRRNVLAKVSEQADSVVRQFKDQYKKYKEQAIHEGKKTIRKVRDQRTESIKLIDNTAKKLNSCVEEFKRLIRS